MPNGLVHLWLQIVDDLYRSRLDRTFLEPPLAKLFRDFVGHLPAQIELGSQLVGTRHVGHRKLVFETLLLLVKGRGEVEDDLAALSRHHPASGEAAAVADAIHLVQDLGVHRTRSQKVGVQRVDEQLLRYGSRHRRQRLGQHVAAEQPPPPEIGGLAHVPVLDHFLQLEHTHDLVAGVDHLVFLRRGEDSSEFRHPVLCSSKKRLGFVHEPTGS
jgi:hypothetical protein